jgi:arginyl-tRNA synthetase
MEIVRENIGTVFTESDGAIVYKGEQDGLHTRVFITKQNTATYECKEVGLNWQKMQDWQYDLTIIPTASEQNGYFDVVIKAIEKAVPELDNKIEHIGFGMVSLTSGKMSSRKGNILSAPELVTTVEEEVGKIVNSREGFTAEEKLRITEKVAMAAVKYAFLRSNIMQNMTFDIKESVSFEGNSGPYLQYTYARIKSVLNTPVDTSLPKNNTKSVLSALNSPSEIALIKWIERYEETVTGAADSRSPHLIANYLFELAQRFNSFYKQNSINSAETNQLIAARRQLSESVANLLAHGLGLLGIEVVEKM